MDAFRVPFNRPPYIGTEMKYIEDVVKRRKLSGDGFYTKECSKWFEKKYRVSKALLTTSCTHATEMAVMISAIRGGDEVIMPSFTFVSTANSVVLRGGVPVFIDIEPDTMNIDASLIEDAITDKTKAIIPVHYAGVSCDMDAILEIAERRHLVVIEDAAQAIMSKYKGKHCGTLGDFGCISFHETKNISMGEGGALLIRDEGNVEKAEIIREKGTDRSKFFRGEIDKYTWVDAGSSYLPSELNAAYLWGQLELAEHIISDRMKSWKLYYEGFHSLANRESIELPTIPKYCEPNGHIFYIKCRNGEDRDGLLTFLKRRGIGAVFHYIPLHSSTAGRRYGRFNGEDRYTTKESERLLRLPMYYGINECDITRIIGYIEEYYDTK